MDFNITCMHSLERAVTDYEQSQSKDGTLPV